MKEAIEKRMREEYQNMYADRYELQEKGDDVERWVELITDRCENDVWERYRDYIDSSVKFEMVTEEEADELHELNSALYDLFETLVNKELPEELELTA